MVERIVVAAREVLVDDGYDAFSTNRVAAKAEVSPGSLYQYFPDKAALVEVLAQRWVDQVADDVARVLLERIADEGPAMIRSVAEALLEAVERDVVMLRLVWQDLPGSRNLAGRNAMEQRVRDVLEAYLALRLPADERDRATRLAWVLVVTAEFLTVRFVLDEPAMSREAFVDELVALSLGSLGASVTGFTPNARP